MSINNTYTVTLDSTEIGTILCGLQWSINHHNSLDISVFDGQEEKTEILDRHNRLKAMFRDKLARSYPKDNQDTSLREETFCPCPPETSDTALDSADDVDGGIFFCEFCELQQVPAITNGCVCPDSSDNSSYLDSLRSIQSQIQALNKSSFDKSLLSEDEHYALLAVELELERLIHFDPTDTCSICSFQPLVDELGSCHDCYFIGDRQAQLEANSMQLEGRLL